MEDLNYNKLLEPWKLELIVSRAKRMGLQCSDIQDVQQGVIREVICFSYKRAKSNGATEATALTALIDNYLKKLLRAEARYREHLRQFGYQTQRSDNPIPDKQLAIDVRGAVELLPKKERLVCQSLGRGYSKYQIARMLGCGWYTVDRLVNRIREHFEKLGLDEWVGR